MLILNTYIREECFGAQPHDLSVDIWAVGLLTLQLFAGFQTIPRVRQLQATSQDIINEHLGPILRELYPAGPLSTNAEMFIRNCLSFDTTQRPTAKEALRHPWFCETSKDRVLYEQIELEALMSWTPRCLAFPAVKAIGTSSLSPAPPNISTMERSVSNTMTGRIPTSVTSQDFVL